MNWTVIIIETLVLTAAFTAMVLIPLVKNPVWWIWGFVALSNIFFVPITFPAASFRRNTLRPSAFRQQKETTSTIVSCAVGESRICIYNCNIINYL